MATRPDRKPNCRCQPRLEAIDAPQPTRGVRLANGDTLISDQLNHQVIEVDRSGHIVFDYGHVAMSSNAPRFLDAPYDAKVVGDYPGLSTPPE